jgi:hypothetical protein
MLRATPGDWSLRLHVDPREAALPSPAILPSQQGADLLLRHGVRRVAEDVERARELRRQEVAGLHGQELAQLHGGASHAGVIAEALDAADIATPGVFLESF